MAYQKKDYNNNYNRDFDKKNNKSFNKNYGKNYNNNRGFNDTDMQDTLNAQLAEFQMMKQKARNKRENNAKYKNKKNWDY